MYLGDALPRKEIVFPKGAIVSSNRVVDPPPGYDKFGRKHTGFTYLEPPKYDNWATEKAKAASALNRPMQDYTVPESFMALRQPIVSAHPHAISAIMATKPLMRQELPTAYTAPEEYPYMTAYRVATDPSSYEGDDMFGEFSQSSTPLLIIIGLGLLGLMLS